MIMVIFIQLTYSILSKLSDKISRNFLDVPEKLVFITSFFLFNYGSFI